MAGQVAKGTPNRGGGSGGVQAAKVELTECNVEFVNMDELSQCSPTTPIAKETVPLITKPRRRWFFFRFACFFLMLIKCWLEKNTNILRNALYWFYVDMCWLFRVM